nr:uncharacterized protein CI109_006447 [Kwoniella shandongensis]KAA5525178.1 hypothetical protein CI109_006447 [Kwoniella shandongensis]
MTFDKGSMRDGASDKGKKHDWCLFSRMGLAYSPDDTASEHKRKFWKRMKVGGMMSSGGGGSA